MLYFSTNPEKTSSFLVLHQRAAESLFDLLDFLENISNDLTDASDILGYFLVSRKHLLVMVHCQAVQCKLRLSQHDGGWQSDLLALFCRDWFQ